MKTSYAYYFIVALTLILSLNIGFAFAAEEASSIMCDNGIGDMDVTVEDTCGEPNTKGMNEWVYNIQDERNGRPRLRCAENIRSWARLPSE